jgi:hypothetical protein
MAESNIAALCNKCGNNGAFNEDALEEVVHAVHMD